MKQSYINQLRSDLLEQLASLASRMERLTEALNTGDPDWGERSAASELSEVNQSLEDAEWKKLNAVQAALDRIEQGNYGMCTHCGTPISPTRLKAVPWATLCKQTQEST